MLKVGGAVALVDAFDFPDNVLNSTLGRSDGNVYEACYQVIIFLVFCVCVCVLYCDDLLYCKLSLLNLCAFVYCVVLWFVNLFVESGFVDDLWICEFNFEV